jgi:hypothetical protein
MGVDKTPIPCYTIIKGRAKDPKREGESKNVVS